MPGSATLAETLEIPPYFAVPVLHDNYAWVIVGPGRQAVVVDPGEATPVLAALARHGLTLVAILATHHHHDHVGGIAALVDAVAGPVQVWGSVYDHARTRIPRATHLAHDDVPFVVAGLGFRPLTVPGHTLGAVAFWCAERSVLFTGDTLFLAGCGRLFEGNAADMWRSLQRLRDLPLATQVCCGHDYLDKNLRFAATLLPSGDVGAADDRPPLRLGTAGGNNGGAQGGAASSPLLPPPSATLATERLRNPFLRADDAALKTATGRDDATEVFAELRRRRDVFA